MELAVNITAYLRMVSVDPPPPISLLLSYRHRRIHSDNIALFYEEFSCFVTYFANLNFWNWSTCAQLSNRPIQVSLNDLSLLLGCRTCPNRSS